MNESSWIKIPDQEDPRKYLREHSFVISKEGNPYHEVTGVKNNEIAVNPYLRMYDVLEPILEEVQDPENAEAQKLFDQVVREIYEIDLLKGYDLRKIKQEILRDQIIAQEAYGEEFGRYFQGLSPKEQLAFLNAFSIEFETSRQPLAGFIYVTQEVFEGSMIFREKKDLNDIYLFLNTTMNLEKKKKLDMIKMAFFPVFMTLSVAWEAPFIITDLVNIGSSENRIV